MFRLKSFRLEEFYWIKVFVSVFFKMITSNPIVSVQ